MLQQQKNLGGGYDEVLVATMGDSYSWSYTEQKFTGDGWSWSDRLPNMIEAFVSVGSEAGAAINMHRAFKERYPNANTAVVGLNLGVLDAPFQSLAWG